MRLIAGYRDTRYTSEPVRFLYWEKHGVDHVLHPDIVGHREAFIYK